MHLLADENFPGPVIRELRLIGHDVLSVKEQLRGVSDEAVLRRANDEERVLVTFDKDFGDLAIRQSSAATGVILFRLRGVSPAADNARVIEVLQSHEEWRGLFTVVTDSRVRSRPLPPAHGKERG